MTVGVDYIRKMEEENVKKDVPEFGPGDTVEISIEVREGDKKRIQRITGTVIARKHGGIRETVTIRRTSHGEGVELVFPIHSPKIAQIKVKRRGRVRRAKLYYIREKIGKAAKIKELN